MTSMSRELTPSSELAGESTRRMGGLRVMKDDSRATLPLSEVRIAARVADLVAQVSVRQKFRNPFPEPLEAVYIFPLGGGAAVSSFEMRVGERVIRGACKERGKAREEYRKAVEKGKRASLLEQDRDDVFTVQVGNLPPGEEIAVRIEYSERLPWFDEGYTELRLPLVVAPRYIPGQPLPRDPVGDGVEWDTDQVPDASRITPPRLAPGVDPAVALGIEVEILDGLPPDLTCSQHAMRLSGSRVALARQDEILDRDFVLRWSPAARGLAGSLLVHRDGTGMLTLLAPKDGAGSAAGRDVIFVLDRSGSMGGLKMASASRACSLLLSTLGPGDRFAVVAFDDSREWFADGELAAADEGGIARGQEFLRKIQARGGTELAPALEDVLGRVAASKKTGNTPVVVILTDGQVGNESRCLKLVQNEGKGARFFTVGIDTAVNEAFLARAAALGRGTCSCVVPGTSLDDALRSVAREIGEPLVMDLAIDGAADVAPSSLPDLFRGRAAAVYFRPAGNRVTVRGRRPGGAAFEEVVAVKEVDLPAITHLWARARIRDLEDAHRMEPARQEALSKQIIDLSVRHSVLSRFTAYLAVDELETVNERGEVRRIVQPVHVPAAWFLPEGSMIAPSCAPALGDTSICALRAFHDEEPSYGPRALFRRERNLDTAMFEFLRRMSNEANAGKLPEAGALKRIRRGIRDLLRGSTGGSKALLEKIDRVLAEIIEGLKRGSITAGAVHALLEACIRELEGTSGKESFWTESI